MKRTTTLIYILILLISFYFAFIFSINNLKLLSHLRLFSLLRSFSLLILILSLTILYVNNIIKSNIHSAIKNISLSIYAILFLFFISEIFFSFKTKSHSFFLPYSSQLWLDKYYKLNRNGFRDDEIKTNPKKKNIAFIGDSFTEGSGIDNPEDRYSNIVKNKLTSYNVYNFGINGYSTRDEINTLKTLPVKPDILFWQYFFNDFEGIKPQSEYLSTKYSLYSELNRISKVFVTNTMTFNFVYWQFPHDYLSYYIYDLKESIKDSSLMATHFIDLKNMINYCQINNIKLVVIVFPLFIFPENHIFNIHSNSVIQFFQNNGIKVIDVNKLTKHLPIDDKIVNNLDPHANEKVNKIVADQIIITAENF